MSAPKTNRDLVCDQIISIMETYHEQDASPSGVDTPGGLEHMGDVWRLFAKWEALLKSPEVNLLPELVEGYTGIADAAQGVIDNWEKGDLAEAVRNLDQWITCAREQLAKANNINIEQKGK
jgi:hypothetical protein